MAASNLVGYARVSTNGQELVGQIAELKAAGCVKIYSEKASGARSDRPELAKLIKKLLPGDVVVVVRLDRLARSTRDLLNLLDAISKARAGFRSLKDQWADTLTPHGKLMLTVLGGLAEFERSLITARTSEGRKRARANGVRFGRPFCLSLDQRRFALAQLDQGKTQAEIAKLLGCDPTTIGRLLKREEEREGVIHSLPVPVAAAFVRAMRRA